MGRGPQEQLGEGSDCRVGHRGTAHTLERETGTVSALGGAGSWKTALGCLTGLQARNSWGVSAPLTHPSFCVLEAPAGLGDPGPTHASRPLPRDHLSEAGGNL